MIPLPVPPATPEIIRKSSFPTPSASADFIYISSILLNRRALTSSYAFENIRRPIWRFPAAPVIPIFSSGISGSSHLARSLYAYALVSGLIRRSSRVFL